MRWAVLCLLLMGCGKPTAPTPTQASTPERPPLTFDDRGDVIGDYHKNVVAADAKWKGKRGTQTIIIADFGRSKDGTLWVSVEGIVGQPHNVYYALAPGQEEEFAKLRRGKPLVLECTCEGREDDGDWRGIVGYNFRVNFTDCIIRPPK